MMRLGNSLLAALAFSMAMAAPAAAVPILIDNINNTVTFELLDDGVGIGDLSDTVVIDDPGDGIEFGDGSDIGDQAMIDGEFIRVFESSISFNLFGGGADVAPGFLSTGYGASARYVLSDLVDPGVAQIVAVAIVLSDVINVALGSEVFFTADTVTLMLGTLGIAEGGNLGLVTLNLTLADIDDPGPPAPVPEPGTLLLLGSGIAAVFIRARRSARRSGRLS
jgi:hypothetical protein